MGTGIHQCLGFAVAKMEAAVLVEAVVERFPNLRVGATSPVPQTASLLTHSFEALHLAFQPTGVSASRLCSKTTLPPRKACSKRSVRATSRPFWST